uniref:Uncharacterized protein n=1 Tax=Anguilla anguilla TaxID=7936 RepID=A0A0E9UCT3_ANGAN
MAKFDQVED